MPFGEGNKAAGGGVHVHEVRVQHQARPRQSEDSFVVQDSIKGDDWAMRAAQHEPRKDCAVQVVLTRKRHEIGNPSHRPTHPDAVQQ
jgi:hypothetical protein